LFVVAALMMLAIAFMPHTGRYLFALFSVLVGSLLFYAIFALWHWTPTDPTLYQNLAAHWSAHHPLNPTPFPPFFPNHSPCVRVRLCVCVCGGACATGW
jgi:hypothetical protein